MMTLCPGMPHSTLHVPLPGSPGSTNRHTHSAFMAHTPLHTAGHSPMTACLQSAPKIIAVWILIVLMPRPATDGETDTVGQHSSFGGSS